MFVRNYPVIVENVSKSTTLSRFLNRQVTIARGEKVAFVGKNGEGKSTMIQCIMNQIPFEGKLAIGHNTYRVFSQMKPHFSTKKNSVSNY